MIKSILNLFMAFRACGSCAGMMIISPYFSEEKHAPVTVRERIKYFLTYVKDIDIIKYYNLILTGKCC